VIGDIGGSKGIGKEAVTVKRVDFVEGDNAGERYTFAGKNCLIGS
jgi:hypothetical protein